MRNIILFVTPALIWSSTWYVIKFQLGEVDPLVSVGYRFAIAGILLLLYCKISKRNLKYQIKEHLFFALQGMLLFGINYWLVYLAELTLASGLVAIIFSLIIFFNIFFSMIFLKMRIRAKVLIGGLLGIIGTAIVFQPELKSFLFSDQTFIAILFGLLAVIFASLGNIISAYNQKNKLPVIQTNAFGMLYGGIIIFVLAIILSKEINFDYSVSYSLSLFYLAVFGSIISFNTYLKLVGNIGPDKAAYVVLITPLIALIISSFFEQFNFTGMTILGVLFLLSGNILALKSKKYSSR